MNEKIIIGIIGGGGIFTPELIEYLADNAGRLGPMEIRLMDIDKERQTVVGGLCERILRNRKTPITLVYCDSYEAAIGGADYVLVQFRVGGADARINDELLGKKYKIPFVETVSVCGFAAFLRTYYEVEKIASVILKYAPGAWVMNFSNPAGVIAEAFDRLGVHKVIGVCNASASFIQYIKETMQADDLYINWRGLNHFTVTDVIRISGVDVYDRFVDKFRTNDHALPFTWDLVKNIGFIPNQYFKYYLLKNDIVAHQQQLEKVRSEQVKEINAELLNLYKNTDTVPPELKKRGGYGYSHIVVDVICSLQCDDHRPHYIVVKNGTTLPELPEDAFVEVPAVAVGNDIKALQVEPLPEIVKGMMLNMKICDRMMIKGAMERKGEHLRNALLIHPLIGDWTMAGNLYREVLELNAQYIPHID